MGPTFLVRDGEDSTTWANRPLRYLNLQLACRYPVEGIGRGAGQRDGTAAGIGFFGPLVRMSNHMTIDLEKGKRGNQKRIARDRGIKGCALRGKADGLVANGKDAAGTVVRRAYRITLGVQRHRREPTRSLSPEGKHVVVSARHVYNSIWPKCLWLVRCKVIHGPGDGRRVWPRSRRWRASDQQKDNQRQQQQPSITVHRHLRLVVKDAGDAFQVYSALSIFLAGYWRLPG